MKTDERRSSISTIKDSYRPLKIAQVAAPWFSVPPKHYGGTESVISNLSEEQVKQGHQVTLFASGDSYTTGNLRYYIKKSLSEQEIPWGDSTEAYYHFISTFREIKQYANNYDIVHIHLSSASDLILFQLVSQIKVPHVCTLHSQFPFDRRKNHRGEGDRYYLSFSGNTPIIAISNRARENALRDSGLPLKVIGVIPHGLPDNQFLFGKDISERHHLIWIGRITRDKGTKYAVEAAIKAKRKIIVAGIVDTYLPESVNYFYQEVLPLIQANPEYAEYIGPVTNGERLKLLKRGFCFLNPIEWEEPFGLVMIEAMACGCPVISYKRGAAHELIKPGINGDFAASVDEMVAKIEGVGHSINRQQMVRDTWNNYSVTTMAKRYDMKYREIINTQIKGQLDRAYSLSANYLRLTHSRYS